MIFSIHENGITLLQVDPSTPDAQHGFATVRPSRVQGIAAGFVKMARPSGAWAGLKLSGMQYKKLEEPDNSHRANGFTSIRMGSQNECREAMLLAPCTPAAYATWIEKVTCKLIRRFAR